MTLTIDAICARCGGSATQMFVVRLQDGRLCFFRRCDGCTDTLAAIAAQIGEVTDGMRQAIVKEVDDRVTAVVIGG